MNHASTVRVLHAAGNIGDASGIVLEGDIGGQHSAGAVEVAVTNQERGEGELVARLGGADLVALRFLALAARAADQAGEGEDQSEGHATGFSNERARSKLPQLAGQPALEQGVLLVVGCE